MSSIIKTNNDNRANVLMVTLPPVGPIPMPMICPFCDNAIQTEVESVASCKTHLAFAWLCTFLCWPCAPCVYACRSLKAQEHYCPKCDNFLGVYNP